MAQRLVDLACGGDIAAIREVFDRVEGKAVQVNENHNFGGSVRDLTDDQLMAIIQGAEPESDEEAESVPPGSLPH